MWRHPIQALCFALAILAGIQPVEAHAPYEYKIGSFVRSDGAEIAVIRHFEDGILGPDPMSIRFRLGDGVDLAKTDLTAEAVVSYGSGGVEIFQYRFLLVPIAHRVGRFDGYSLTRAPTVGAFRSIRVHTLEHWRGYGIVTLLGLLLAILGRGIWRLPTRGIFGGLRTMGIVCWYFVFFVLAYDVLVFEPLSLLVLLSIGGLVLAGCALGVRAKRRLRNGWSKLP
jgi:hypothetical protein